MSTANERIETWLVPEFLAHQKRKSEDYNGGLPGFENADVLGVRGQFSDIWRKIWKLKKGLWDGEILRGEQPREILLDLIGHAFLALDMIERERERGQRQAPEVEAEDSAAEPAGDINLKRRETCGEVCFSGHLYRGACKFRKMGSA